MEILLLQCVFVIWLQCGIAVQQCLANLFNMFPGAYSEGAFSIH